MTAEPSALPRARLGSAGHLIGYYGALVSIGLVSASLGPTLEGLARQTGVGLDQISLLFAARSGGYITGSLLGGRLYDRVRGHPILAGALLVMALGLALVPLAPWLWLLAAIMTVVAVSDGAVDVGANTLLVWTYRERVGPYMNGLHFAFGLGSFLAPIIVAQAVGLDRGLLPAYWALAALILPASLWILRLPSPARVSASGDTPGGERLNLKLAAGLAAFFALYVAGEIAFGAWIYTYASQLGLADQTSAAYLTSAFWGALTIGRLAAIPLAARLRPRTILLMDVLGALASVGLVLFWPQSATALWLGALGAGLFMASVFPTLLSFAGRRMQLTGRITSLFFVCGSLGGVALPWLIGQLFERVGPRVTMAAIFTDLLIQSIILIVLMGYRPRVQ